LFFSFMFTNFLILSNFVRHSVQQSRIRVLPIRRINSSRCPACH